ncbi:hypothetical protein [Deinococcus koreensis]|uniref:Uncharacterized protein n=1 Tax=Deinococcus koreensis TaxID=2054903 RepID=A0A2K3UYQ8_9DEIO|nr:hypothetical protein [Deinococcus koreensis]PNY81661.1 hypothetical protein CVO96_10010 [Deinococcus koreensis]
MTQINTRSRKVTDVDEIAAEAQAALDMIRGTAEQIQHLVAVRSRFEDMAQQYEAMTKEQVQLGEVITEGRTLHGDFRRSIQHQELTVNRLRQVTQEHGVALTETRTKTEEQGARLAELSQQTRLTQAASHTALTTLGEQVKGNTNRLDQLDEQVAVIASLKKQLHSQDAAHKRLQAQLKTLQILLVLALGLAIFGLLR